MFKKLFITCDEATLICDKNQYKEATLFEKIQISIHFIRCKICRLYTKQNNEMSSLYKTRCKDYIKDNRCMSKEDKEALKRQLEEFKN